MTKRQALIEKITAGTHRISGVGHVTRRTRSGEWVTEAGWRKDVIASALAQLTYGVPRTTSGGNGL